MNLREQLTEQYDGELLLLDPAERFDKCIVGIGCRCGMDPIVVYDSDLVIQAYVEDGMSEEEAIEFFEYNTAGAYVGERTPIFLQRINQEST